MKKIILLILLFMTTLSGFSQIFGPEGFENTTGPDTGSSNFWALTTGQWSVFDSGTASSTNNWGVNSTSSFVYQGTNSADINRENIGLGNTLSEYLVTPAIIIPATGTIQLKFYTRTGSAFNDLTTTYQICVANANNPANRDNPSAYIPIQTWTEAQLMTTFNIYEEKTVDINFGGQSVYIAFVKTQIQNGTATEGDRWLIDDVRVVEKCNEPSIQTANNITINSALLGWTAANGVTNYEIEIVPNNTTPTGTGTVVNGATSFSATTTTAGTGLEPNTTYQFYVRSVCSATNKSIWIGPFSFTTKRSGLTCAAPITITGLPYSTTDNTSAYADTYDIAQPTACAGTATNFMTGNDVFYSYTPTTSGAISITMTPTGGANATGIFVYQGCSNVGVTCVAGVANTSNAVRSIPSLSVTAGVTYIIVLSSNVAPQTYAYSLVIQQLNCAQPNNLAAIPSIDTANLSWGNPSGTTSWEVAIQPLGSAIPSGSGITVNTTPNYSASGLAAATQYQYWVRADCNNGTFSAWAGPFPFNTTICDPVERCNYTFRMIDSDGDGWNGGTMQVRQNGIVVATLTGPADSDNLNPVNVTVALCNGIPFDLFWNTAGTFPNEIGISIINSFNQTLFVKAPGSGNAGTVLYTDTTNCLTPACIAPINLTATAISQTQATLGWTTSGPESLWQIIVLPAGSPAPAVNAAGWVNAPTNPFTVNNLTAATAYDFYVRPICTTPNNPGPRSIAKNFNTTICNLTDQCNYTFRMIDTDGDGWNGGTMQVRQNGIVVATLTGPADLDNLNPVNVTVALCNGIPFDLFWNTAGTFPNEIGISIINSFNQTLFVKAPGSGTAGTVLYTSTVDCLAPACLPPINLTATAISRTQATLGWTVTGPESSWQIIVLPAGSPAPAVNAAGWVNAPTNPFTISNLTSGTSYDFYVRPICTTLNNPGPRSIAKNFNTTICDVSNQCNYSFIMADDFGDGWNGGTMQVRQNGIVVATLTGPTDADNLNPITVTVPLCHGIPFDLFWNEDGTFPEEMIISIRESLAPQEIIYTKPAETGTPLTVLFSSTAECIIPTCPKPNTVTISAISQTTASVNWTEAGTATQWEIIILPAGSPTPTATSTGTLTTTRPFVFNNLASGTNYDVYVRAICSSTDKSFWSNKRTFRTLIQNDECIGAITAPVNPNGSCAQIVMGSVIGATASPTPNTCTGNDDDDVWYQFTATSTTHSISLLNVAGNTTDLVHVLYSGNCTALTRVYCSDNNISVANNLVIGQTYYVRIYTFSGTPNQNTTFDLCIGTPQPPPSCITNTPAGDSCQTATPICNLNGYCGNTSAQFEVDTWEELDDAFCGSIENNSFLSFVASSSSISFDVWVSNAENNDGIQIMVFSAATCGSGPVEVLTCWSEGEVSPISTNITATGLIPGNTYYIMIDGFGGDVADYVIGANSGISTPIVINTNTSTTTSTICLGQSATLTATGGNGQYTWTPTASLNTTTGSSVVFTPTETGVYEITATSTDNNPICPQSGSSSQTITVVNIVDSQFNQIPPFCENSTAPLLPTTSTNGITGTWSPALVSRNVGTSIYTFTPSVTQCANPTTMSIEVIPSVTPSFLAPAPICNGTQAPILPLTSINGITGTWNPNTVSNTQSGTYTFTPNPNQCAEPVTLNIQVLENCAFGSFANAVWLTDCDTNFFFNTQGSGTSIIGPIENVFPNQDLGTYLSNSNTFKLRGAEVKTFKTSLSNVCSAKLNYRIYPVSTTPPAFTELNLPFFDNCNGSSFPTGGPCNLGDQKWQKVLTDTENPVDLTAYPPGNYTIELFYELVGDVNSTSDCDDVVLLNNNGANFIATYTLQNSPLFTFNNPTTCNATNGNITLDNLAPETSYSLTYLDDSTSVTIEIISNQNGSYTLTGLNAGTYSNFVLTVNGCIISSAEVITLVNPILTPIFQPITPICLGRTGVTIPTTSDNGITGTWSPENVNNNETTTYTFTPNPNQCAISTQLTITVLQPTQPTFDPIPDFCSGTIAPQLPSSSLEGFAGTWDIQTISNTASGVYTFLPAPDQCAGVGSITVTVFEPNIIPLFSFGTAITTCVGISPITILPTISVNNITGQWNATSIDVSNTGVFVYTFTPNPGQCAVTTTLTVTVTQPGTIPTFDIGLTFTTCQGNNPDLELSDISTNNIIGIWNPATLDFSTTGVRVYTFTPNSGQCATSTTFTLTVLENVIPTFTAVDPICENGTLNPLPTTSINAIIGSWSPVLNNRVTTEYTFTPSTNIDQCATNTTMTIIVNPSISPTFDSVAPICQGDNLNPLPTVSLNGITGVWSPALLNNNSTTTYTFSPTSGVCSLNATLEIVVNQKTTPLFNQIAPLCIGASGDVLSNLSTNGITGSWNPSIIPTDQGRIVTAIFTPDGGQCANNGTLDVTVTTSFDFMLEGDCINNSYTIYIVEPNGVNLATADFSWQVAGQTIVGETNETLNITQYLNSTTTNEFLPLTFSLIITDENGCVKSVPIVVDRIACDIQKGVSINNDGKNETFDLTSYDVRKLTIYNRYGTVAYDKASYTNEWKGQTNTGDELPDGTYFYTIEFNSGEKAKTGWIYISRKN